MDMNDQVIKLLVMKLLASLIRVSAAKTGTQGVLQERAAFAGSRPEQSFQ